MYLRSKVSVAVVASLLSFTTLFGCGKKKGSDASTPSNAPGPSQNGSTGGASQSGSGTDDASSSGSGSVPVTESGVVNIDTVGTITTATEDLKLGSSLSLATPKSDTELKPAAVGSVAITTGLTLATPAEFDSARSNTFVADQSMASLKNASKYLCLVSQSGYTQMVGAGNFIAHVNEKACSDRAGNTGQPKYSRMIAKATRADKGPVILKFWMKQADDAMLSGKLTVAKGATEGNPFGIFRMAYVVTPQDGTSPLKGTMEAFEKEDGHVLVKVWDADSSIENKTVAVFKYESGAGQLTSGVARATVTSLGGGLSVGDVDYSVAFNSDYYVSRETKNSVNRCLDRANFQLNVLGYRAFDQTSGARVKLSDYLRSLTRTVGATADYGLFSADGIWFSDQTALKDGDQVGVVSPSDPGNFTTYTAHVILGQLKKNYYETLSADELHTTRYRAQSSLNTDSSASPNVTIQYNPTTHVYDIVETLKLSSLKQFVFETLSPAVPFTDISAAPYVTTEDNFYGGITLSIDTGNGNAVLGGTHAVIADVTPVANSIYWCAMQCPVGGSSDADIKTYQDGGTPSAPIFYLASGTTDPHGMKSYHFSAAGALIDNTNSLPINTYQFKQSNGEAAALSVALIADADHDAYLGTSPVTFSLSNYESSHTFYNYAIGSTFQQTTLVDAKSNPLTVSTPVRYTFTLTQENDRLGRASNPRYGTNYYLQYSAWGDLQGIPQATDEGGTPFPAFSLKNGAVVGNFKYKATEVEERMPDTAMEKCASLGTPTTPDLPEAGIFADPNVGAKPIVVGGPAVTEGVLAK